MTRQTSFQLVVFLALSLAFAVGLELWAATSSRDAIARKYDQVFHGPTGFNALILGSSQAAHGVDPWVLDGPGLHWFNYAYNGSGPVFQRAWYDIYRQTHKPPDVVLVAADWFMLSPTLERRIEHDSEYLPWSVFAGLLVDGRRSPTLLLADRLAIIKGRERLQQRLALIRQPAQFEPILGHYHDGFVPLARGPGLVFGPAFRADDVEPAAAADFRALLVTFASERVRVVLLREPEYAPLAGNHKNDARRTLHQIGNPALPLLDYNTALAGPLNQDATAFADWAHLNERGSRLFSQTLARDLADLDLYVPAPGPRHPPRAGHTRAGRPHPPIAHGASR
jgi:hypothetical protein